jgi:serine/threonine protein kinase
MPSEPIKLQTAFADYTLESIIGEGGAGRVYSGRNAVGEPVAIKLLTNASKDKRQRFKNEIGFLASVKHPNLVPVLDHGYSVENKVSGPFYVMPRFQESLRDLIHKGLRPDDVLPAFSQILDGIEAAHFHGAIHRDIKPENILVKGEGKILAIADFGVAEFTDDAMITLVETGPQQRLANFQYAAPEQRTKGQKSGKASDIYAIGLILNEMFTGIVPHGTSYKLISNTSPEHAYLDDLVAQMIAQSPISRPNSIEDVKNRIQKFKFDAVQKQKISQISSTVIPQGEIDDPLAYEPPVIIVVSWENNMLSIKLNQKISAGWAEVLKFRLGSYSSTMSVTPSSFNFAGDLAKVSVSEGEAQRVVDFFKQWLPRATSVYKMEQEAELQRRQRQLQEKLAQDRAREEQLLRVNNSLTF